MRDNQEAVDAGWSAAAKEIDPEAFMLDPPYIASRYYAWVAETRRDEIVAFVNAYVNALTVRLDCGDLRRRL